MSWSVIYTDEAKRDLRAVYTYIAFHLLAPETAVKQVKRIMKEIRALDRMPMRHRLYEDEPWHSQGLRFFPVDHYLVFYLPDEAQKRISIVRIMYGGRDVGVQLSEKQ